MKQQAALVKHDMLDMKPNLVAEFENHFEQASKQIEQRAFQLFEARGRQNGHALEDWLQAEAELLLPICVTTADNHNELHIKAEVPGFEPGEVSFSLEKNLLMIHAVHKTHAERTSAGASRSESASKMICRKIALPCEVIPEKLEANMKNGVLEIIAPKALAPLMVKTATAA